MALNVEKNQLESEHARMPTHTTGKTMRVGGRALRARGGGSAKSTALVRTVLPSRAGAPAAPAGGGAAGRDRQRMLVSAPAHQATRHVSGLKGELCFAASRRFRVFLRCSGLRSCKRPSDKNLHAQTAASSGWRRRTTSMERRADACIRKGAVPCTQQMASVGGMMTRGRRQFLMRLLVTPPTQSWSRWVSTGRLCVVRSKRSGLISSVAAF